MRFDQGLLKEIHSRIDIASLIGAHVPLRKRGNDLVGLCPFHAEKTPSFHVHPDKGFFKCFGCGAGGDVINFVEKIESIPFPDAVRMLAARAGIDLENEDPRAARVRSEREAIYEANRLATAFFERMLRSEEGGDARTYCEQRGFSAATIEKFHLGYAPAGWQALADDLRGNGVDAELAAKAGLLKARQGGGFYDFYRNRLMVPTYATTGEVIAFGGRALGDDERKYVNSPTTPVHTKGRHLFGLNIARRAAAADRTLIVVEGYLDAIALHQAGFENTVAALGTSFTEEQAHELRKFADNVFLCFDGDTAGANAATKAVDIATKVMEHAGTNVKIVILPDGEDPDSFIRTHGNEAFRSLLESAKPSIEFKLDPQIDRLRSGFEAPSTIAKKAEALIQEMTPRAEWDKWRVYVAGRLKVNVDDLRNSRFFANTANFGPRMTPANGSRSRHAPISLQSSSLEREVLGILIEDPALARDFREQIPAQRFKNEVYRRIYERIMEHAERLTRTGDIFALFAQDAEESDVLTALGQRDRSSTVRYEDPAGRRAHLQRVVERLQLEEGQRRYKELSQRIDDLVTSGEPVAGDLRDEYDALVARLKK